MVKRKKKKNLPERIETKQPWLYGPRAKVKIRTSEVDTEVYLTRTTVIAQTRVTELIGNLLE